MTIILSLWWLWLILVAVGALAYLWACSTGPYGNESNDKYQIGMVIVGTVGGICLLLIAARAILKWMVGS